MTRSALPAVLAAVFILAGCAAGRVSAPPGSDMPYPPKTPVKAGEIYHLPTGLRMSLDNAVEILSGARLVAVGETHDSIRAKTAFVDIARALNAKFPGKIAIGMEMFREPKQPVLDRWVKGELTERQFLKEVNWYDSWGYDFAYYRPILEFARDNRIDIVALNPPKALEEAVRMSGIDNVPADLKAALPAIDVSDPYERAVLKSIYGDHVSAEGAFNSFVRIQALWEETMAQRVVDYLKGPRGEGKRILTLTGGWHVRYGFGMPKRVVKRMPIPYAIVLPEEISVPADKEGALMDVELPDVPLLPADFYWWIPYEHLEGQRVRLGVFLSAKDNAVLIHGVEEGSPAQKAGIKEGDTIVSLDNAAVSEPADVQIIVREKRAGDRVPIVVRRGEEEKTIEVVFFKMTKRKHP